ncbi:MAG: hypothetical protein FJ276_26950, partial [Planctomycetes bacterium]|nr:hypothetical protein [Planctomycetota bacterium]
AVNYTVSGTATDGADYTSLSGSVTIGAGSANATITVTPIDDAAVEGNETVVLTLSTSASYTLGTPGSDTVTIADNEVVLPTVSIAATDPNAAEAGSDTGTFTVTRTGDTASALVVNYGVSGTATSGVDYASLSGTVTLGAGSSTATITVTPMDDSGYEGSETVTVTLAADAAYTIGAPSSGTVTIADDEWPTAGTGTWDEMPAGSASGGGISNNAGASASPVVGVSASLGPIAAWRDDTPGNQEIYVLRWNGSAWVELGSGSASGGGISANSGGSASPSIVIGVDGYPVVAWGDATPGQSEIYVKRWDGSAWVEMGASSASGGGISNNAGNSYRPSLAPGPDNNPVIAWQDESGGDSEIYVKRWDGSAWVEMGSGSASGGGISANSGASQQPCLRRGADGTLVVAWDDASGGDTEIYVRRWDSGSSSWVEMGVSSASGGGISNNAGSSSGVSAAVAADGKPVVAWQDTSGGNTEVYVLRWDGSAWVELGAGSASGGGISANSGTSERTFIALAADGNPIVGWRDTTGNSGGDIYIKRWNGSEWGEFPAGSASGAGISANAAGSSFSPCIANDSDGSPLVAWQDSARGDYEIYVRRYSPPTVTVTATDPNASETGPDAGAFTVTRAGGTTSALIVNYTLGGAATNGVDYALISGSVTIGAGSATATATVTPIDDASAEGSETVILTLAAGAGYTVGSPSSATATIADNDVLYSPAPTGVDLLAGSDTGASNADNITSLDNSSSANRLTFRVSGTVNGATVELFWNGTAIGAATASGTETDVTTNGSVDVPDGPQSITARQTAPGQFESTDSPALAVTIDTQATTISSCVAANLSAGNSSTVTVTYSDSGGVSTSSLDNNDIRVTGPNGYDALASFVSLAQNGNSWIATYTITPPGGSWDSADFGAYTIALTTDQIYDLAGNVVTGATVGTFVWAWQQVPLRNAAVEAAGLEGGEGMQFINAISYAPTDPNVVYMCVDTSQIWKSEDGGNTWRMKHHGFMSLGGADIVVDPINKNVAYAAGTWGQAWYRVPPSGFYCGGIYRTLDGGENWELVKETAFAHILKGKLFAFDTRTQVSSRTGVIYAGAWTDQLTTDPHQDGLMVSTDGGDTWNTIGFAGKQIMDLKLDPSNQDILYVVSAEGLFKVTLSNYTISTSTQIAAGISPISTVVLHPSDSSTIYVQARTNGVHQSTDGG